MENQICNNNEVIHLSPRKELIEVHENSSTDGDQSKENRDAYTTTSKHENMLCIRDVSTDITHVSFSTFQDTSDGRFNSKEETKASSSYSKPTTRYERTKVAFHQNIYEKQRGNTQYSPSARNCKFSRFEQLYRQGTQTLVLKRTLGYIQEIETSKKTIIFDKSWRKKREKMKQKMTKVSPAACSERLYEQSKHKQIEGKKRLQELAQAREEKKFNNYDIQDYDTNCVYRRSSACHL